MAALVQNHLRHNPFDGAVYVFRAKRADRLKLVYWDGSGLVMAYKRLEQNTFKWPATKDGAMRLDPALFGARLAALDWHRVSALDIMPPAAAERPIRHFTTAALSAIFYATAMELPADLPNDIDALKTIILASEERNARKDVRIEYLEKLVTDFKHALFGAKSEKADLVLNRWSYRDGKQHSGTYHPSHHVDPQRRAVRRS